MFSLVPTTTEFERPGQRALVDEVFDWLCAALDIAGAGARTSVGYGRFVLDDARTRKLRNPIDAQRAAAAAAERRRQAERTPEGRWQLKLEGKSEEEILGMVRDHLQKNPLSDPKECLAFAKAVAATGLLELWRRGQRRERSTKTGEAKCKERAKLVDNVLSSGE